MTELGCDPNLISKHEAGQTPLMFAAASGSKECVDCLLDLGADPNICLPVPYKISSTRTDSVSKTALLLALDVADITVIEKLCAVTTADAGM